jgi:hypothetical protein
MNLAYSPKQIYEEIEVTTAVGLVPMIEGSPGSSKSAIVAKFAKDYALKLIDIRLGQYMPEDLNGLPMRNGDKAAFVPFDTFPIEGDPIPPGYQGWLIFFDEITSAQKPTQAAAYKIILDKMTGNKKLHPNVIMVAAGNKSTDKAVVTQMSTALASRMVHYSLEPTVQDFTEYGLQAGIDQRILAFVNEVPSRLMRFNPEKVGLDKTFPCPRTWEFLSRLIKNKPIEDRHLGRLAGTIGQGTAIEFLTFVKLYDKLPKLPDILANPQAVPVPAEASAKYATMFMLVEHADLQNIDPIVEYIKKFGLDQQIVFSRSLNARDRTIVEKSTTFAQYINSILKYMS